MDFGNIFSGMGNFTVIATTVPFLIVAAVFAGIAINRQMKARGAARGWSTTMGQVVASGVQPYQSRSGNGGYSTKYRPVVNYIYTVNGQQHSSDRLSLGIDVGFGSSGIAQRQVMKYPAGSTVQVYYNPNNPAESTLETRAKGAGILWFVVIVILVILAITTLFASQLGNLLGGLMNMFRS